MKKCIILAHQRCEFTLKKDFILSEISLIMLGAGNSSRFGLACKKQWLRIGDDPLWLFVTKNIAEAYPFKDVIIASNEIESMKRFGSFFKFARGGETRQESLKNALSLVRSEFVMVSDIARADIPHDLITRLIAAAPNADCVVPVLKVADTTTLNGEYVNRDEIRLIQTPQLSRTDLLKKALETDKIFSDDSGAMKSIGAKVWYIQGDETAKKLTYKDDLKSLNLPAPSGDFFVGNGFDTHKFTAGNGIKLCGVEIPCDKSFIAHSDGDVALHALCDALFGAAGLGDIGEFYPDSDENFKGVNSLDLLTDCTKIIRSVGFEISNVDITIIAQEPKISPFKDQMRLILAKTLNITPNRVNIKATTTENLGFTGRKEGVAAIASATLKYFDWQSL